MDTIFIQGLQTQAIIGIYEWEREEPQPLIFDLEMQMATFDQAADSDDIEQTINYAAVSEEVCDFVAEARVELIETLAKQVLHMIFAKHPLVEEINLCLSKPQAVPQAETVGLIIKRKRGEI